MNTSRFSLFLLLAVLAASLSGCQIIGDIFKGGVAVGVIGVLLVVGLVFWIISKMSGGGGQS